MRGPDEPAHLRPRATARSDHRGAFALELAGPGKYTITASAPGFLPARKDLRLGKEESARIEIHLGGGGITVHGLVEDSGGGPIPGAQVWGLGEDVGIALTTTDAAGSYRLRLPRGRRVLFADADGYAPDRKNIETQSDLEQTFRLNPAAQLHGRVLDKTTASVVPGAIVRAQLEPRGLARETTSDASGSFSFRDLDPGRYLVSAGKGKLAGFVPEPTPVTLGAAISDVLVILERAFAISGRVRDSKGRPVPSAQIKMEEVRGVGFGLVGGNVVAIADDQGHYRIEGVLPARLRLGADGLPYAPADGRELEVKNRDIEDLDFVLPPGGEVRGRVLTYAGQPVADAEIITSVRDSDHMDAPGRSSRSGHTEADGTFVIKGLGAGRLTVTARHLSLGKEVAGPSSISPGQQVALTIRLKKPTFISGVVRYEGGEPAQGVRVRWDAHERVSPDRLSVSTDGDGSFRVGPAFPGTGNLKAEPMSASRHRYGPSEGAAERKITVEEGKDINGIELVLPRYDRSIEGRVLDSGGMPLEGVAVGAEFERGGKGGRPAWFGRHSSSKHISDGEGRFRIPDLREGTYTVWASHPAYPSTDLVHVKAGDTQVVMRVRPGAGLSGVAETHEGRQLLRYDVQVIPAEGPNLAADRHFGGIEEGTRRTVVSPSGAFQVGGLEPGRYDVLVTTLEGGAGRLPDISVREGEMRRDLRVVVGASMRLKGTVLDADTGQPLANLGVGLTRTNVHVHARTGTDGGFVLDRLVPGRTIVINVRSDRDYFGEVREITLPLEGTELEIPPFRLLPVAPGRRGFGSGDLGIEVSNRQGPPTIKAIAPGSPALKAGLEAGSIIRSVDGRDILGLGRHATTALLWGEPGTKVVLVVRGPPGTEKAVTLTRVEREQ